MRNRNHHISLWLSDTEYSHLKKQLKISGLNTTQLIRSLIEGVTLHPRPPDEYRRILYELSAIGNNINRIAHTANAQRHISTEKINEAVELVDSAISLVRGWN